MFMEMAFVPMLSYIPHFYHLQVTMIKCLRQRWYQETTLQLVADRLQTQ